MIGIKRGVPILIPVEKLGVLSEALWETFFAEAISDVRIIQVRLGYEPGRRPNVLFFLPVNGDLRFGEHLLFGAWFLHSGLFFTACRHVRTPLENPD